MSKEKDKCIIIKDFHKGISESHYIGFGEMRGLNITDRPGVVTVNNKMDTDGTFTGGYMAGMTFENTLDHSGNVWGYTSDNKVWERTGDDTWVERTGHTTTSNIEGIIGWKGYIAIIYDSTIDWYDTSTNTCYTGWASDAISSGGSKKAIHFQDDCLYIATGKGLDKIEESGTFNPSTGSTYTITKTVLDIPEYDSPNLLLSMGDFLWVTGKYKIYPWDASSTSFDSPVTFNKKINFAIVYRNRMYVQTGWRGEWYVTDGANAEKITSIPRTMLTGTQPHVSAGVIKDDLIHFGLSATSTATPLGIYSLNPVTGAINLERLISTGGYGSSYGITFHDMLSNVGTSLYLLVSWEENSVYKVDKDDGDRYTSDEAFLISPFYKVGTKRAPKTFRSVEIQLSKPLITSDSVKVYYRTAGNDSWSSITTMNTVGEQSTMVDFGQTVENIQFKVVLNNYVELLEIRIC